MIHFAHPLYRIAKDQNPEELSDILPEVRGKYTRRLGIPDHGSYTFSDSRQDLQWRDLLFPLPNNPE